MPRYRGRTIAEVLNLTVDQGIAHFEGHLAVTRPLRGMQRVGLGYLTLGQPAASLSGGEAQRLKLVRELTEGAEGRLLILDEPTVGLHGVEVVRLIELLQDLVRKGNTVLVIEHHLEILAACDWLVELGPEGGDKGGRVVAQGPAEIVIRSAESRIGPFLEPLLHRVAAGAAT